MDSKKFLINNYVMPVGSLLRYVGWDKKEKAAFRFGGFKEN